MTKTLRFLVVTVLPVCTSVALVSTVDMVGDHQRALEATAREAVQADRMSMCVTSLQEAAEINEVLTGLLFGRSSSEDRPAEDYRNDGCPEGTRLNSCAPTQLEL